MTPRFFYIVPAETRCRVAGETRLQHLRRVWFDRRRQRPSGGAKIIYQHCGLLTDLGFTAHPVHMGRFNLDWFPHTCNPLTVKQALRDLRPADIVVCPEVIPEAAAPFAAARRIVFVQGWSLVGDRDYPAMGFERILTVSTFCQQFMQERTSLPCDRVTNGIDLNVFRSIPEKRVQGRVLYLARKQPELARRVLAALPQTVRKRAEFTALENRYSQQEMVEHYQAADIFMTISYPEGFGLHPLEAMACGCAVVGFTGGGGGEHMIDGISAAVAEDGDTTRAADKLEKLLTDAEYREKIREGGTHTAKKFGINRMKRELEEFAENFLNP
jgi:hypothetical protein